MMIELYPLKFHPVFKEKIWGGSKIKQVLGKNDVPANCGESWEISGVGGNVSLVKEGALKDKSLTQLIDTFKADLVGEANFSRYGNEFPLLIKFLDANDDLSIQVHPNDELAKQRHNSLGKTEMWYVVQADENAKLISGFSKTTEKAEFSEKVTTGKLTEILNIEEANQGDTFFIPAGRVHTIGKGLLIAEIQQTSDVTYRIYDFDRTDAKGNKRELHIDEALDAIDYGEINDSKVRYTPQDQQVVTLVNSEYFTTNKMTLSENYERSYQSLDSFKIIICIDGAAEIDCMGQLVQLEKGETCLLPAICDGFKAEPKGSVTLLESYT